MLSSAEQNELAVAIIATADALGQTMTAATAKMIASDLAAYDADTIANALRACRLELRGRLVPAEIISRVVKADGRPTSDEAWPLALRAMDESDTVMLTPEIRQALADARPVLITGDKIGGRKTFQAAYDRYLDDARRAERPVEWELSIGFDPQLRLREIEDATRKGLLSIKSANQHLKVLAHVPITTDGQAIAGLLTGKVANPSPDVRQRLEQLRADMLADRKAKRQKAQEKREADAKAERSDLEKRRANHQAAVEQLEQEARRHG